MIDPVFGLDNYKKPKMLTEMETYVHNFIMLLLGKPGFYPSMPHLGIDIQQYLYELEDDFDPQYLKSEIVAQCRDFLPFIKEGTFEISSTSYDGKLLLLFFLPSIDDKTDLPITVGVTTNESGNVLYKIVDSGQNVLS